MVASSSPSIAAFVLPNKMGLRKASQKKQMVQQKSFTTLLSKAPLLNTRASVMVYWTNYQPNIPLHNAQLVKAFCLPDIDRSHVANQAFQNWSYNLAV